MCFDKTLISLNPAPGLYVDRGIVAPYRHILTTTHDSIGPDASANMSLANMSLD